MNALLEKPDTVVPTEKDAELATEFSRRLAMAHGDDLHIEIDGERVPLPRAARRLIEILLVEMSQGHAVTIFPIHAELTTQEAAEYLNVSRPYLVGLLESGKIPFHKVGTHRRVKFADVKAYQEAAAKQREDALHELTKQAQDLKMGY